MAEDVRALARSLARDLRQVADEARRGGWSSGRTVGGGLRGMAEDARRGFRAAGWSGHQAWRPPYAPPYYPYRPGHRRGRMWYPPYPPAAPRPGGDVPGPSHAGSDQDAGMPGSACGPPWARPHGHRASRQREGRQRSKLPPVRHRWDATTVLGLLAVLFGLAWLLGALHALHLPVESVVAVGLMLLGASLVVTGRTDWSLSRRSWPVWLGFGLVAVLIATSSTFGLGRAAQGVSFGNRAVVVSTPGRTVQGGFGQLLVDASGLTSGTAHVQSVAGRTIVDPPSATGLKVNAHLFAGQICVDGRAVAEGIGASTTQLVGTGPATATLDVHQMFGQIVIGSPGCVGRR